MNRFRAQCRTKDKLSIRRFENIDAEDVELHSRQPCRLVRLPWVLLGQKWQTTNQSPALVITYLVSLTSPGRTNDLTFFHQRELPSNRIYGQSSLERLQEVLCYAVELLLVLDARHG